MSRNFPGMVSSYLLEFCSKQNDDPCGKRSLSGLAAH